MIFTPTLAIGVRQRSISLVTLLALSALVVWTITRIALWGYTGPSQMSVMESLGALVVGFCFDLATLAFLIIPFGLGAILVPARWRASATYRRFRWTIYWLVMFGLLFGAVAEFVFWLEFTTRFNFIAVDYLVYTHEVIGNIRESYPLPLIFLGLALLTTLCMVIARRRFILAQGRRSGRQRWSVLLGVIIAPLISALWVSIDQTEFSENAYANELAGNGLYGFASAMRRNDLDYDKFYAQQDAAKADQLLKELGVLRPALSASPVGAMGQNTAGPLPPSSPWIKQPKHLVLVSVESLSAAYLGVYGHPGGLTPKLDQLTKESLVLNRLYATGTRTVRGLEALSLGTPPVPGQAIVHRPDNHELSTLGSILKSQGFNTHWIYGGYGYFDNMNAYFRGNGHAISDRTDFPKASIAGENIWGVADESLFDNALSVIDESHRSGRRFFAHIMTTSNHRPYTFPDGRIDLPSGSRDAAVKYTDYAIGRFIDAAKSKPWFNDTLFVIVSDHCASVSGKSKLPVESYHIVGLMYGPQLVKPSVNHRLMSQIDLPPTLVDVLGVAGASHFFGQSLARTSPAALEQGRAFISNYQELGYYKNDQLVVLSPKRRVQGFSVNPKTMETVVQTKPDPALVDEAIAYYQTASRSYKAGRLKLKSVALPPQ